MVRVGVKLNPVEARRCDYGAAEVETLPARLLGVGRDDLQCGDHECGCDWEVDVEDHPPVGELGEEADEDADRSTGAADCAQAARAIARCRRFKGAGSREAP
jgi:hypothetical protein